MSESNIQVDFGIINADDSQLLRSLIDIAICPVCSQKTSIVIKEGKTIVTPICHEKFADLIGKSVNRHKIDGVAIKIRGVVLNSFTTLEKFIDEIIRKDSFDSVELYHKYIDVFISGEMPMNIKKKLFKICIEKHGVRQGKDLTGLVDNLNNIIDKRNIMAHWATDTSTDGMNLLINQNKIRFITFDKKDNLKEELFDYESAQKLEQRINKLLLEVIDIFKSIRNT